MREILFRGKRKDNGKWVEGDLLNYLGFDKVHIVRHCLGAGGQEVIPETVGQYTGLTDKNGKRIFEGDIIKQTNVYDGLEMIGIVVFSKSAQFVIHHTYTKDENKFKAGKKRHFAIYSNCEVIGNIHDNPELLKDGD